MSVATGATLALAVLVVASLVGAPPILGASGACLVRNVTQGTAGTSLRTMLREARDGDELLVGRQDHSGSALRSSAVTTAPSTPDTVSSTTRARSG